MESQDDGFERDKLLKRFDQFNRGAWTVEASRTCCQQVAVLRRRRSRRVENDLGRRVGRAEALVHMGELSSSRQALEGASLAPDSEDTLQTLRDPVKRPQEFRFPFPRHLAHPEPGTQFRMDRDRFARNLRRDAEPLGVLLGWQ